MEKPATDIYSFRVLRENGFTYYMTFKDFFKDDFSIYDCISRRLQNP